MSDHNTPIAFPQLPPTAHAFTVTECIDDVGRRIVVRDVVFGTVQSDFSRFVGINQIMLQVGGGPPQPNTYRFPIDGVATLQEAFARWDQCAEDYGKMHIADLQQRYRALQERQQAGLVIPDPAMAKRILTP